MRSNCLFYLDTFQLQPPLASTEFLLEFSSASWPEEKSADSSGRRLLANHHLAAWKRPLFLAALESIYLRAVLMDQLELPSRPGSIGGNQIKCSLRPIIILQSGDFRQLRSMM